jgi:hypothetical protein
VNTPAINSASLGILRGLSVFNEAAQRISSKPIGTETVRDIIEMKLSKDSIVANAAVLRTDSKMHDHLIDILA